MAASNRICIKDGKVSNIIYADEDFVILLNQTEQYDRILNQSDYLNIQVGPGYTFDGINFSAPILEQLDINTQVQIKIQKAIIGFNTLMVQFAANNVLQGITQLNKTELIADTLEDVMRYGQSGSLYAVISALQAITPTGDMSPFLTQVIINNFITQIQQLLASL